MSILYIMRHGMAEEAAPSGRDADRRLTDRGRRRTAQVARGLSRLGVAPGVIFTSPLVRSVETASIVAHAFPECTLEELPELAAGGAAPATVRALHCAASASRVLLVGHEPDLSELISYLLTSSPGLAPVEFKKASVAALRVSGFPPRSGAILRWLMTAKQLARL